MRVRLLFATITALLSSALSSCVTPNVLKEETRGLQRVALVSLYGTRDLGIVDTGPNIMFGDGIGGRAIELLEGDTAQLLEGLFAEVVPLDKAVKSKRYDDLPEAYPHDAWSQRNDVLAVDLDNERAVPAMAAIARALDVDAAVVVRHEWWLSRERYELVRYVSLYDRCTIVVVDRDGLVLWRQSVLTRTPTRAMWGTQLQFGLGGPMVHQESIKLARETARMAYAELKAALLAVPVPQTAPSSVRSREPPALLEPTP